MIPQIRRKNKGWAMKKKELADKNSSVKKTATDKKNPITINEGFICEKCKKKNQKAAQTCRNHCTQCLYSKHVDLSLPGDRHSDCNGLMEPIKIDFKAKKGYQIMHHCEKCGQEKLNKTAEDDNLDEILKIMERQNLQ